MQDLILYDYFRSSASYRVRIALNLKKLSYQQIPVNLLKSEQRVAFHKQRNPQGAVPVLELDGLFLPQSLAICEYLEESYPERYRLLPDDLLSRARVRGLSQLVACDIHPLNNLRVLRYLKATLEISEEEKLQWYRHWIYEGFEALETMLAESELNGDFCHGNQPGLADLCLVPQVYNAQRFEVDLSPYPMIQQINAACQTIPAFMEAAPERQSEIQPDKY